MEMFGSDVRVPQSGDEKAVRYLRMVARGLSLRNEHMEDWRDNERVAYAEHEDAPGQDNPRSNKLTSFLESRTAALAYRSPRVKLTPRNEAGWEPVEVPVIDPVSGPVMDEIQDPMTGMVQQMPRTKQIARYKVREALVNYLLGRHDFRAAASGRLCVQQALLSGIGVMKVGYEPDYEEMEEKADPIPAEDAVFVSPEELRENYEVGPGGAPMIDENGMLVPKGDLPISERWFIDWCDTKRMIFDPDGENDFSNHAWVAFEDIQPLDKVKKNGFFRNTKNLKSTGVGRHYTHEQGDQAGRFLAGGGVDAFAASKDDRKMVRLFEVWDFDKGRLVVLADGHGKLLRDDPIPDGVSKQTGPWAFYRPFERVGEWYGHAPATTLRKKERMIDVAVQSAIEEMRKAAAKIIVNSDAFDSNNLEKLRRPTREIISLDDLPAGMSVSDVVAPLMYPSVAPQMFDYVGFLSGLYDEDAGQPGESRGVASADTATQVNALTSRESMREDYQRNIYRETWREALKKLDDSVQQNMTIEQAITILDGDGTAWIAQVDPEMIQCDCDVDVDVQDMEPMDRYQDRQNFVQVLTMAAQAPFLFANPQAAEGVFEMFGITDKRISSGISQTAMMQLQAEMQPKAPPKPETGPPQDEAQAISQQGGEM
jgi:hypothetical protein